MIATRKRWTRQGGVALALALLAANGVRPWAQSTAPTEDDAKLNAKVSLTQGNATLAEVVSDLSRQTGLKIAAADYLQDRKLVVALDGLTARETRNALAALNNWTWYKTDPGRYLMARRAARRPASPGEMPQAMQSCLPTDILAFMGLTGWRNMTPGQRSFAAFSKPYSSAQLRARAALVAAIRPLVRREDVVRYAELSAHQQEDLLLILLFDRFGTSVIEPLCGAVGPYQIDPERAVLELQQGKVLMVEMYRCPNEPGSGIGFGQNVVDPFLPSDLRPVVRRPPR